VKPKRKCESHNEAKPGCKVTTLDEKIVVPNTLLGMRAVIRGWPNILLIFYFNAKLSIDILL
jgi:hypothetical protein